MDGNRFDDLSRKLATGMSRRGALKGIAAGLLGALGLRGSAAAQVSQAFCGNVVCAANPGVCKPGCVCCVYRNGNSRCRPPQDCTAPAPSSARERPRHHDGRTDHDNHVGRPPTTASANDDGCADLYHDNGRTDHHYHHDAAADNDHDDQYDHSGANNDHHDDRRADDHDDDIHDNSGANHHVHYHDDRTDDDDHDDRGTDYHDDDNHDDSGADHDDDPGDRTDRPSHRPRPRPRSRRPRPPLRRRRPPRRPRRRPPRRPSKAPALPGLTCAPWAK